MLLRSRYFPCCPTCCLSSSEINLPKLSPCGIDCFRPPLTSSCWNSGCQAAVRCEKRSRRAVTRLVLRRCGSFLLSWDSQVSLEGSRLAYSTTVIVSCLFRRLFRVPIQLVFFEPFRFSSPFFRSTPCTTGIKFQTYFWQSSGSSIFFDRLRSQSFSHTGISRQASLFCLHDTILLKRVATM